MECLHLTLRLSQFRRGGETLADSPSIDLAGQPKVWAVIGLVRLMTTAIGFSATTLDCGDGATAKIAQLQDLHQDAGTLLFEGGEGLRQKAPPILTYVYVRIIPSKKEDGQTRPCMSRTHLMRVRDAEVEIRPPGAPPSSPRSGR